MRQPYKVERLSCPATPSPLDSAYGVKRSPHKARVIVVMLVLLVRMCRQEGAAWRYFKPKIAPAGIKMIDKSKPRSETLPQQWISTH